MRKKILLPEITVAACALNFLGGCGSTPPSKEVQIDPNDSPITIADGSITLGRTTGKFDPPGTSPTKNYSVTDNQQSVATYISVDGCGGNGQHAGCSSDPSPSLIGVADWVLELNDGTQLAQGTQDSNKIDISLSKEVQQQDDGHGNGVLVISDRNLTQAKLSFGGPLENGGTLKATFTCPTSTSKCKMKIHYCWHQGNCS